MIFLRAAKNLSLLEYELWNWSWKDGPQQKKKICCICCCASAMRGEGEKKVEMESCGQGVKSSLLIFLTHIL